MNIIIFGIAFLNEPFLNRPEDFVYIGHALFTLRAKREQDNSFRIKYIIL